MKAPVHYSRGRLIYTGRLAKARFAAWADSPDGSAALKDAASGIRLALFGKVRAARRRMWRQLVVAARSPVLAAPVQRELNAYLRCLETLVYAHDLPTIHVDLRRLIVVPRIFVNADAYRRLDAAVEGHPFFRTAGSASLRDWFVLAVIDSIDAAIKRAHPSPSRPLPGGREWVAVGLNEEFVWRVPFGGPSWTGHYYVLELTRSPVTRAVRKTTRDAIARMETSLPSLSRLHRDSILRQVGLSLEQRMARA